ncbi:MAG: glutathione S-transferase family protein [Gammaproteobacteria bacterium]
MTPRPILHHYDASPFTQKCLRMLGLKQLEWDSVETPMIMPKPDLTVLTGGYRGTPVLQLGADVYVDNQRIAVELERRYPQPALFPDGNSGLFQALVKWSDAFFRCGLHLVIATQSRDWPEEFLADRKALFSDIDFDAVSADVDYTRAQLRAHAALLNVQLADGRNFLAGSSPSLADIHAFSVPWFTRAGIPEVNDLLAAFTHLPAWEERVAAIGEGTRNPIDAAAAHAVAKDVEPVTKVDVDPDDAQKLKGGQIVTVEPDDARRGAVTGELVVANALEVAVRHHNDTVGEVVVHFPRLGYRVTPN